MEGQAGRLDHAIKFVVIGLAQVPVALLDDDMAGGTGAAAATGVLQVNLVVEADVQERPLLAMLGVRHGGGVVVDRDVERKDGHLIGHGTIIANGCNLYLFDRNSYDILDCSMESRRRSIAKAFSYRVLGSISTGGLVFLFTGDFTKSVEAAAADSVVKIGLYFLHERLWNYIAFGRPKPPEYEI